MEATDALRMAAAQVMEIHDTTLGDAPADKFAVRFRGRLTLDSLEAYKLVSEKFRALGYTALFRKDGDREAVLAVKGVINPPPSRVWINYLMFGLTVLSVLFTGAVYGNEGALPTTAAGWMRFLLAGWPYLLSLLGILLAHELGHY
ncbi:MAG: site-2 protease family protein, partial [Anaerolineales bacterium]